MKESEAMVGIRCDSCPFSGVIFQELEEDDCPECDGSLQETSVLASE
ncbi:hypothetical protein N0B31_18630 [Salinirubellus salinus]|uniref:Uncharacterized protein n=1 Tax=Salinirubellus salinus TaxID=1364945 RepID=A0A9E7R1S3_9EURY|nr:hypothetical protein [Salinirubellus salinus]UWM54119.1 hypothetical protein N0B31_18630 [Salinirubellus salinus]